MSKIVKYGGGFIGFCFLLGVCGVATQPSGTSTTSSGTASQLALAPAPAPAPACSPTAYTAKELAASMKDNEARTAHFWKQAGCASVSGVVKSVGSDFLDNPFVVLGTGKKYDFGGIVHCKPKDPTAAFDLSKGQKVTVRGTTGGEVIGTLVLEECEW